MPALDPWTLWMANTAILLFAAGVWAVLGGFYRIAPGAAAFFFASQWLALPALPCQGCGPPWPGAWLPIWVQALCGLLALGLLAAGVSRLLKLRAKRWLAGPALALCAAALLSGVLGQETLSLRLALLGRPWPLRASFGVAAWEAGDSGPERVLARADAALYEAKRQGRDRVC